MYIIQTFSPAKRDIDKLLSGFFRFTVGMLYLFKLLSSFVTLYLFLRIIGIYFPISL